MAYLKVQGTHMIRDTTNGALINRDIAGLEEYNKKRQLMSNQRDEINKVKSEIDTIKEDVSEIKQLILKLLDKG